MIDEFVSESEEEVRTEHGRVSQASPEAQLVLSGHEIEMAR